MMTDTSGQAGEIVTFYSFKGGVGRTMALANVAFLLAMNGKRVLVMDWDLEAPGLAYYFRGLLGSEEAAALDHAPGILDLLCDWGTSFAAAQSEADGDALQARFEAGTPYQACVRSLAAPEVASQLFPPGASLDLIGPGAKTIAALGGQPYTQALADFSWPTFFDGHAGGFMLDKLRQWAKRSYDVVLIDSRTGLADIAGVCTIQMPDVVALCFVLNHQNMDGIANVAAAVRAKRGDAVRVRAMPMRVARRDSMDGSDAKGKAVSVLTKTGGMALAAVKEDMETLSVALEDSLPYYETLAPFAAKDPALDPLTLNYLRLAKNLLEPTLRIPEFDQGMLRQIRERLSPGSAAIDYLVSLESEEPKHAAAEWIRLMDDAIETLKSGGHLDDLYRAQLVKTGENLRAANNRSKFTQFQNRMVKFFIASISQNVIGKETSK